MTSIGMHFAVSIHHKVFHLRLSKHHDSILTKVRLQCSILAGVELHPLPCRIAREFMTLWSKLTFTTICSERESNPHDPNDHRSLNPARLPIPPSKLCNRIYDYNN